MHRSYSSLFARWLYECGLPIGDDLLGPKLGNPDGHYEDLDFVKFHMHILQKNGLDFDVDGNCSEIEINQEDWEKGRRIVDQKNQLYPQWGWKDPRTCLFLNFWRKLLPNARYLILFREHTDVIYSLINRYEAQRLRSLGTAGKIVTKIKLWKNRNNQAEKYLGVWNHYYRCILSGLSTVDQSNKIFINTKDIIANDEKIFHLLGEEWGFNLKFKSMKSLADNNIKRNIERKFRFAQDLVNEEKEITSQLHDLINF